MALKIENDDSPCGQCLKIVDDNSLALKCDGYCKEWYHIECVKVTKEMYDQIGGLDEVVKWLCEPCNRKFEVILAKKDVNSLDCSNMNVIVAKLDNINKNNLEMTHKLDKLSMENVYLKESIRDISNKLDKLAMNKCDHDSCSLNHNVGKSKNTSILEKCKSGETKQSDSKVSINSKRKVKETHHSIHSSSSSSSLSIKDSKKKKPKDVVGLTLAINNAAGIENNEPAEENNSKKYMKIRGDLMDRNDQDICNTNENTIVADKGNTADKLGKRVKNKLTQSNDDVAAFSIGGKRSQRSDSGDSNKKPHKILYSGLGLIQ